MKYFWLLLISLWSGIFAQPFVKFTLSNKLLAIYPTQTVSMGYSRAYPHKKMDYQSILMKTLLTQLKVKQTDVIELIAKDNFSVYVPANLLLQTNSNKNSIAYLAIEPKSSWPKLNNDTNDSAGPYQVIWTNPELSHISDEYWAWSVTDIAIHKTFPKHMIISSPQTENRSVLKGYQIYISHCAACHNINHVGKAVIGPDIGGSKNPLWIYKTKQKLAAFIRNPNQFRPGRMSGSSKAGLTDDQLDNLIDYFAFLKD